MNQPTPTQRNAPTCVSGLAAWTTNAAEAQPTVARIPALWGRFANEHWFERLERMGAIGAPAAVYTDYKTDVSGEYRVLVGREIPCGAKTLPTLQSIVVPAGQYLVFRFQGTVPGVVIDGWQQVWTYFDQARSVRRAYTADLEIYHADGAGVDIWIAIR